MSRRGARETSPRTSLGSWRGAWPAGLALMLLLGLAALGAGVDRGDSDLPGSAASSGPNGRRAARLLLEELGFEPALIDRPPGELPREAALMWLSRRPELSGSHPQDAGSERDASLESRLASGLHAAHYYRRFVDEGGVLVAPARPDVLEWLGQDLEIERFADGALLAEEPRDARSVKLGSIGSTQLDVRWKRVRSFAPRVLAPDEVLLSLASGEAVGARIEVGRGAVALLPDVSFLDNRTLGQAGHGKLFVRLVEELAPSREVWFDEYAAGAWRPDTPLDVAFAGRLGRASWHALAFLVLLVWMTAWTREFPRDPREREPVSGLTRARARAGLWQRAGRSDLILERAGRALVARWSVRAGLEPAGTTGRDWSPAELGARAARLARWAGWDESRGRELFGARQRDLSRAAWSGTVERATAEVRELEEALEERLAARGKVRAVPNARSRA